MWSRIYKLWHIWNIFSSFERSWSRKYEIEPPPQQLHPTKFYVLLLMHEYDLKTDYISILWTPPKLEILILYCKSVNSEMKNHNIDE